MIGRRKDSTYWRQLGQQLRVDAIRCSAKARSGHPTSAMSAADLIAVLLAGHLRYDFEDPRNPSNDVLLFSKGHASPLLYAAFKAAGAISDQELLTYRSFGSRLEGHPTPVLPWIDVATGSLGQGLPVGVGMALAGKHLEQIPYRVWVLHGDSEMAEGSVWEALEHAAHYELDNLTAIFDVNRLGQRGETMVGWNLRVHRRRVEAFGWHVIEIDGHDVEQIDRAYSEAVKQRRPTAILAKTVKGKGVSLIEDQDGWHGKVLAGADAIKAVQELGGVRDIHVDVAKPPRVRRPRPPYFEMRELQLPRYELDTEVATRQAYGEALTAVGAAFGDVVALDAEVGNSTFAEIFAREHPERFFEMFVAEQQLIAAAVGLQARGWKPFASTFAAFLTRAYDFVRMAAISRANLRLCGSHAGVTIGEDGPSQMGLEDMAAFRAVHGSTVLHPCDANQTASLVAGMAALSGIVYLRTLRPATPVIYDPGELFEIGGCRTLRKGDDVTIVACGVTVHEALTAADRLAEEHIAARVIDAYTVKPIDAHALRAAAMATRRIVTVEDHWPEGGLGDAVLEAVCGLDEPPRVTKLAVRHMPRSGTPEELLRAAGIDSARIVDAVRALVGSRIEA
jgi:transketolase